MIPMQQIRFSANNQILVNVTFVYLTQVKLAVELVRFSMRPAVSEPVLQELK